MVPVSATARGRRRTTPRASRAPERLRPPDLVQRPVRAVRVQHRGVRVPVVVGDPRDGREPDRGVPRLASTLNEGFSVVPRDAPASMSSRWSATSPGGGGRRGVHLVPTRQKQTENQPYSTLHRSSVVSTIEPAEAVVANEGAEGPWGRSPYVTCASAAS